MRRILTPVLFVGLICLFTINGKAQSSENTYLKQDTFLHHISVDAGGLIKLIFNSSSGSPSPFFVSWRKLGQTSNQRMGFGLNMNVQTQNSLSNSFFSASFSIGKEKFKDFNRRWQIYYGWDALFHLSTQRFGDSSEFGLTWGWTPLAGLHFKINEHLWITTEAAFQFLLGIKGGLNSNASVGLQTKFMAPGTVFLGYRF